MKLVLHHEYSFCTCEIASLAATACTYLATECQPSTLHIIQQQQEHASHLCCSCIAEMPRMTAQDALGTEKPRMTSMTHQQWDHINAVFKYVDEHGSLPIELVSCAVIPVKLPAADHGYASSTVSREDSWTLASTLSTEDSWTVL